MARISTYALDAAINDADKLIGTDADNNNQTKNFSLEGIAEYVIDRLIDPDANQALIPVFRNIENTDGANATRITGSIMYQDTYPTGTKITVAGDLTLERDQSDTTLTIISDTSNIGEENNPAIKFIQDGGAQNAAIGFNIIDDTGGGTIPASGNRFWIVNAMEDTAGNGGITFGTAQVDGWDNAIGRFIIRGDGKGLFGHPDSLYNKTLGSQFEIYDNRDENTTTDPSFSVYGVVDYAAPSGNEGGGGIKQILDVYNSGVFQQQESIMLIPGTNSSDFAASTPIAFYTNSDMDTASPSGFAGMIFDSGNWLLDGSGTFTNADPGYQLKVEGTALISGNASVGGSLDVTNTLTVSDNQGDGSTIDSLLSMSSNRIIDLSDPINGQDAATKSYVDTAVTGLLDFKGTFRADTGEIISGVNDGNFLYSCPGGAGSRVAIEVGDYYIVASAGGNFYCSGDLLNIGDSVYGVADAAADSSTINDWGTVEGDNIEGSGVANTIPLWTGSQALGNSILSQDAGATLLTIAGQLNVDNDATFDTNVTVTGNTTLGDASADLITQNATLYLNGPVKDKTNTLGSAGKLLVSNSSGELNYSPRLLVDETNGTLSVFHASSDTTPSGDNFTLDVRTEKGRLQVEGEDVDGVKLDFENSLGVGTAAIENNGSQNQVLKIRSHGTSGTLGEIRFETNSVEAVRIDENQRVGVGTVSPGAMLDVVASSSTSRALDVQTNSGSLSITTSDTNGSKINFKFGTQNTTTASIENNGTENQFLVFRAQGTTSTDGNIRFITNGTDVMRIDENQNVGIGVTSPASKLEVDGGDIEIDDSASGLILRSPNGTRYRITVDNAGNLSTSTV